MKSVKVIGAGSIGNHLAHGCRRKGWHVTVCDLDPGALERTRREIYPQRYGAWDEGIRLALPGELRGEYFDLVVVGTPPDTHLAVAQGELAGPAPRAMVVEKPVGGPDLEGCEALYQRALGVGTVLLVGYNLTLTAASAQAAAWIQEGLLGDPLTLDAAVRENWSGILKAHPWLAGPTATYLGHWRRGGGAGGEHSHGINNWQHFAHLLGRGRIVEVSAMIDMVREGDAEYDRVFQLHVRTETGFTGRIVQDVVTEPPEKSATLIGTGGILRWEINARPGEDAVTWRNPAGEERERRFPKTRPDDFKGEIDEWERILDGGDPAASPVWIGRGLDTMRVLAAAYRSAEWGRPVRIRYDAPCGPGCLE
jgi:predicted dehydrogenase